MPNRRVHDGQARAGALGVVARIGAALLGLPARRRVVLRPTPDGIMLLPPPGIDCAAPVERAQPARAAEADVEIVVGADSAAKWRQGPEAPADGREAADDAATPVIVASTSADSGADAASTDSGSAPARVDSDGYAVDASGVRMMRDFATEAEVERYRAAMQARFDEDARRPKLSPEEHGAALLERLQSDPETTGVVCYEAVREVYHDMLIERQWAPVHWNKVSAALRVAAGCRKRYVNQPGGGKLLVFDIPHPGLDAAFDAVTAALPPRAAGHQMQAAA